MEARAKLSFVRLSPQKTRLVVDMVRGRKVQEVMNILKFSPQKAAGDCFAFGQFSGCQRRTKRCIRYRSALREDDYGRSGSGFAAVSSACSRAGDQNPQTDQSYSRRTRRKIIASRGGDSLGQKVHPIGFRLGVIKTWESKWYAEGDYAKLLHEDIKLRNYLKKRLYHAGISKIELERAANKAKINIFAARPGIIIGKKGSEVEALKKELAKLTDKEVFINIQEVRKPEIDAQLVAENVALQLERRVAFRRAMKKAVSMSLKFGAQGIKINCSGRLGGAEMSRTEWYREGRVPLHTLRADIDYGFAEAKTTYGIIGVKVLIFKGEILAREL